MGNRLLSVGDVAEFLGIKPDTVYKWIERHGLPGRKVGRLWKFRQDEIDDWFNMQPGRNRTARKKSRSPRGRRQ